MLGHLLPLTPVYSLKQWPCLCYLLLHNKLPPKLSALKQQAFYHFFKILWARNLVNAHWAQLISSHVIYWGWTVLGGFSTHRSDASAEMAGMACPGPISGASVLTVGWISWVFPMQFRASLSPRGLCPWSLLIALASQTWCWRRKEDHARERRKLPDLFRPGLRNPKHHFCLEATRRHPRFKGRETSMPLSLLPTWVLFASKLSILPEDSLSITCL